MSQCPLCKKLVSDFLKHLALDHEIENAEQYEKELKKAVLEIEKRNAFAKYVDQLKERKAKDQITAEEYREAVEEWFKEQRNIDTNS